jgi:hypothetical protein
MKNMLMPKVKVKKPKVKKPKVKKPATVSRKPKGDGKLPDWI